MRNTSNGVNTSNSKTKLLFMLRLSLSLLLPAFLFASSSYENKNKHKSLLRITLTKSYSGSKDNIFWGNSYWNLSSVCLGTSRLPFVRDKKEQVIISSRYFQEAKNSNKNGEISFFNQKIKSPGFLDTIPFNKASFNRDSSQLVIDLIVKYQVLRTANKIPIKEIMTYFLPHQDAIVYDNICASYLDDENIKSDSMHVYLLYDFKICK